MNAKAATARRIIKARRDANKAHKAGLHTLKSHCLSAGLTDAEAGSVAGALRSKVDRSAGCSAYMLRKVNGELRPVRGAKRYDRKAFTEAALAYNPRAPKLVAARALLLAQIGA